MYRKRSRVELTLRFQRFSSTAWISDKWISHQVFDQLERNLADSGHGMFSSWLSLRWFNASELSLQCFDSRLYPPVLDDLFVSGSELSTLRSESFSLCFRTWIVRHPFIVYSLVALYLAEQRFRFRFRSDWLAEVITLQALRLRCADSDLHWAPFTVVTGKVQNMQQDFFVSEPVISHCISLLYIWNYIFDLILLLFRFCLL